MRGLSFFIHFTGDLDLFSEVYFTLSIHGLRHDGRTAQWKKKGGKTRSPRRKKDKFKTRERDGKNTRRERKIGEEEEVAMPRTRLGHCMMARSTGEQEGFEMGDRRYRKRRNIIICKTNQRY